jgi:multiple sugar transport system substrate-binding protein
MAEVRFLGCDNDVFCSSVAAHAAEFQHAAGHLVLRRQRLSPGRLIRHRVGYRDGGGPHLAGRGTGSRAGELAGQGWYELAMDFAHGKYGLLVDSDHYIAYFENPRLSSVAGDVRYALPPAGPAGLRRPNMWMWSMVMNARSDGPDAAWEFMEWASGSEFLTRAALAGNMNPTRRSTWADPGFAERASQWHGFPGVAMELVNDLADVLVTPAVNYIEVARRWTRALRDAYRDEGSLEQCLGAAAGDIDRLVIRA